MASPSAILYLVSNGRSFLPVFLALVLACAGIYLFFIGFRMLRLKRLILNTPLSRIHSASIGLVEVNGMPAGPQALSAPITGDPCFYYHVRAWQLAQVDNKQKWILVLNESLSVPFFLEDATGRVLVNPQGAHIDAHRSFSDEVSLFSLQSNLVPHHLKEFLATRGLVPSEKIKLEERIIPQGFPLFVFGTLGENTTMSSWTPQPHISGSSPASFNFHPGGATLALSFSPNRPLLAQSMLAYARAMSRFPGAKVQVRIDRTPVGPGGTLSSMQSSVAVASVDRPGLPSTPPSQIIISSAPSKAAEFDPHPSVCIGKGERHEPFAISGHSQRELVGKLAWQSVACIWGGPVLALLCIHFLKVYFE